MDILLFVLVAAVGIGAALGLLTAKNAIYGACFLILNFATVAVCYLLLNAPFLAVVQVSVYAGAIMVLFVFVIMLLGAEKLSTPNNANNQPWQRPFAIILAVLLGLVAIVAIGGGPALAKAAPLIDSSPLAIGQKLFSNYLLPFEVVSVLLLVAAIGAVVLTREAK